MNHQLSCCVAKFRAICSAQKARSFAEPYTNKTMALVYRIFSTTPTAMTGVLCVKGGIAKRKRARNARRPPAEPTGVVARYEMTRRTLALEGYSVIKPNVWAT